MVISIKKVAVAVHCNCWLVLNNAEQQKHLVASSSGDAVGYTLQTNQCRWLHKSTEGALLSQVFRSFSVQLIASVSTASSEPLPETRWFNYTSEWLLPLWLTAPCQRYLQRRYRLFLLVLLSCLLMFTKQSRLRRLIGASLQITACWNTVAIIMITTRVACDLWRAHAWYSIAFIPNEKSITRYQ